MTEPAESFWTSVPVCTTSLSFFREGFDFCEIAFGAQGTVWDVVSGIEDCEFWFSTAHNSGIFANAVKENKFRNISINPVIPAKQNWSCVKVPRLASKNCSEWIYIVGYDDYCKEMFGEKDVEWTMHEGLFTISVWLKNPANATLFRLKYSEN